MGADYEIKTEVLAPEKEIVREIKGVHPSSLLRLVPPFTKETIKCQSSEFYEDRIKWDTSNPKLTQFYGEWRGTRKLDNLTGFWVRVIIHGYQNPADKKGHVKFRLYGYLDTKLNASNPISLLMNYIYFKTFYINQLREYLIETKEWIEGIDERMRNAIGKPK